VRRPVKEVLTRGSNHYRDRRSLRPGRREDRTRGR
jgi:hypothetical protein